MILEEGQIEGFSRMIFYTISIHKRLIHIYFRHQQKVLL